MLAVAENGPGCEARAAARLNRQAARWTHANRRTKTISTDTRHIARTPRRIINANKGKMVDALGLEPRTR